MNKLIEYFSVENDTHRIILLMLSIFIFGNFENIKSLSTNYNKWKHGLINLYFILPAAVVQGSLGFVLVKVIHWETIKHIGLLYVLPAFVYPLAQLVFAFLFLDFFEYVYHVIMHKVKRLWMFHLIHHSDRIVDVSTTLREHPGETLVRLSFTTLWVFLLGAPFWLILFHQFIQITSNVFAHSNFRLSEKSDNIIGLIFITPNLHQVHHHFKQPYTDCNYGDILCIWDRLFGTFGKLSVTETIFGVDNYMDEKENADFKNLMKIPFGKYRPASVTVTPQQEKTFSAIKITNSPNQFLK